MMDDGCLFALFFSCFSWMSRSTRSILIPHTPLYPIYQLSLETDRQTVLFMTIDTFFCLCFLENLSMSILLLHDSRSWSNPVVLLDGKACSGGGRWAWAADVVVWSRGGRAGCCAGRESHATGTMRRLVPTFRLSQIKLEGKGSHH